MRLFHVLCYSEYIAGSRQAVYKSILGPILLFYPPAATADIQAAAEQHIAAIFLAATDLRTGQLLPILHLQLPVEPASQCCHQARHGVSYSEVPRSAEHGQETVRPGSRCQDRQGVRQV